MKDKRLTVEGFRGYPISRALAIRPGEIRGAPPWSFLYQSGYLSLRPGTSKSDFTLDYPNRETLEAMSGLLMYNFFGDYLETIRVDTDVYDALDNNNLSKLIYLLNDLFGSIPYDDYKEAYRQDKSKKNLFKIDFGEWLYRSSLFSYFRALKLRVYPEIHGSKGRSDLVIEYQNRFLVIELKVFRKNESDKEMAEIALNQIISKGYYKGYKNPVILGLAINDKPEVRAITAWKTFGADTVLVPLEPSEEDD
jgi:hypothetical protein